jgi:ABC-type multidrug transport system fused ATPase/permease subunit
LMVGRTVILVTHHVTLCLPLAEFLVEIDGGRLGRHGRVSDLRKQGVLDEVLMKEDILEEPVLEEVANTLNEADGGPPSGTSSGDKTPSSSTNVAPSNSAQDPGKHAKTKPTWKLSTAELGKLVDEETRAEGRVSWYTYKTYIQAAGYWSWGATAFLMILIRGINILDQFYLSKWGEAYNHPARNATSIFAFFWNPTAQSILGSSAIDPASKTMTVPVLDDLPPPDENVRPWLLIYFCISLLGAFTVLGYISLGFYSSLQASRSLFKRMLIRLSRAPSRFYDITPVGRILNRFSADMGAIDGAVNNSARSAIAGALGFFASFGVIVYVVPVFAPIALFIAWLYVRLAPPYVRTSRDLRRLESISLSPAFAGFDELLHGLIHVRAFGVEQRYQNRFYKRVDTFQAFDHSYWLVGFIFHSLSLLTLLL